MYKNKTAMKEGIIGVIVPVYKVENILQNALKVFWHRYIQISVLF